MFKLHSKNIRIFMMASLVIILLDLVFARSILNKNNDQLLTIGISLDFIVVIPLLLYFLWFRKLNYKMTSIIPFAILGYAALVFVVPNTDQQTLDYIKYVLIPLPVLILGLKIHEITAHYKRNKTMENHPIETLRKSIENALGNSAIAYWLTHEISIYYYALFSWKKKPHVSTDVASFSYHTNSNKLLMVLVFSKILIIEGVCAHILLAQWSHTVAWLLSIGNVYIILVLIADYRAMLKSDFGI